MCLHIQGAQDKKKAKLYGKMGKQIITVYVISHWNWFYIMLYYYLALDNREITMAHHDKREVLHSCVYVATLCSETNVF